MSPYAPQTYDAVWSIALALRDAEANWRAQLTNNNDSSNSGSDITPETTTLAHFDYSRGDMALEFQRRLEALNFMGVSVSPHFHQLP